MNKEKAIEFLKKHQPMPDDDSLSTELINEYDMVRKYFLMNPDEECIPLFLNSYGKIDGYGVYQLIEDVIRKFDKEKVIGHLVNSLQSKHRSVKYWSAQISQLFADKRLIIPLKNLLLSDDCDTKIAAVTALSQIEDIQILSILEEAKDNESDEEVCEFLEEVISDLKDN